MNGDLAQLVVVLEACCLCWILEGVQVSWCGERNGMRRKKNRGVSG